MSRGSDIDMVDIVKKAKMGVLFNLDEVESIEDNREYLRAIRTLYLEIIREAQYLADNPSSSRLRDKKEEIKEKMDRLYSKCSKETFPSEKFLESTCNCKEEEHIVKLLFSKNGVGLRVRNPSVRGEILIMALRLIMDIPLENGRKYIIDSSRLRENHLIELDKKRRHRDLRRRGKTIEESRFVLNEDVIDALLGHIEDVKVREKDRKKDSRKKGKLINKVETDVSMSDVVLPEDKKDTILAFMEQSKNNDKFMEEWNLKSIVGERQGVNMLFSGPPGTGKTMLSKAVANDMNKDLSMVSFGDLLNSYFGNTEENVSKLFEFAGEGSIILIDEADAILQKRAPAKSSCDRSENRIINIVLQSMENHSGIVIFTTNIARGLDRAVERRLDLKLELPVPGADAREEIWKYHLPDELPLGEEVDIRELAENYEFTGGEIRNVVLNAARITMKDNRGSVSRDNLLEACRKEEEGSEAMDYQIGDRENEDIAGYM